MSFAPAPAPGGGNGGSAGAVSPVEPERPYAILVADAFNHTIRRVDGATGRVITLAGNGTRGNADGLSTHAQ